jgi:biopolymer transport protein ExbB
MNNGLTDLWSHGDAITHVIAVMLFGMSVLSWMVMFIKGGQLARMRAQGAVVDQKFWKADSLEEGASILGRPVAGNAYQMLIEAGRDARESHSETHLEDALSPDEWLQRCLTVAFDEQSAHMASGLGVLASIGSTAPFIGLFGTVWGIYHALQAISAAGQSNLAQVAGPVGEALVMTALGLFVAIPAVLGYNALNRGNRGVLHRLVRFRHELHAYLMSGDRHRPASARATRAHTKLVTAREA